MTQKIPLMILPLEVSKKLSKRFTGIGELISRGVPGLKYDLEKTDIKMDDKEYLSVSMINCFFSLVLLFAFFFSLAYLIRQAGIHNSLLISVSISVIFSAILFYLLVRYPSILARKKADMLEKNLVFALKDMLLQIGSGTSLYDSIDNISRSDYGLISKEFGKVSRQVSTGSPLDKSLENAAVRSGSEHLRKTLWQLINAIHAGSSIKSALKTIIANLTHEHKTKIKDYSKELNMWSLIYMLFAVAIPTIGITMMVILSSFAGMNLSNAAFIAFVVCCFALQIIMIGMIKKRRPVVNI